MSLELRNRLRALDIGVFCLFIGLILVKAVSSVDVNWDSMNYHLPFAARRVGLIPKSVYTFQDWLELCYQGIPPVPYYIYGWLWRFAGSANAPNILGGLALAGFCVLVARTLRVSCLLTALLTTAIPVIQVSLPTVYTDLITNLSFTAALLLSTSVFLEHDAPLARRILAAVACAAIAANFKLQFTVIGGAFVPALAVALYLGKRGERRLISVLWEELKREGRWLHAAYAVAILLCYASALKNLIVYGNPVLPMGVKVFGMQIFKGYSITEHWGEPRYLGRAPAYLKWVLSVGEYMSLGDRPVPYTLGQGETTTNTSPSLRMGGYCAVFVIYNLALFTWSTLFGAHPRRKMFLMFTLLTVAVACFPGSFELRYYSFWMLYLVFLNVGLLWQWAPSPEGRRHFICAGVGTFLFVGSVTGWSSFIPRASTLPEYVKALRLDQVYLPKIADGGRYCLLHWGQLPVLGSSYFYPGRSFFVREAVADECSPDLTVIDYEKLIAESRQAP